MKKRTLNWLMAALVVLSITSCGETPLYTKSYSFPDNTWKQDVKPVFKVNIPDTTTYYNITITLRTTTDYPYSNLWFFLHSKTPGGQTGREPVKMDIAYPDGSWIGETSGTIVTTTVSYSHRKFPQKGWYTFTLEQGITQESAKEITDISYTIERDENQQP